MPNHVVKLVSSDNVEFIVDSNIALQSETLALFLDPGLSFARDEKTTISLPITSKYLGRIVEFMAFKHSNGNSCSENEFKISDEETMDLLEIASYLKI